MGALSEEMPRCVLLFLFQLSGFKNDILSESQQQRNEKLSFHHYGLMPAFLNGLLEAAPPGITFVDGNESAYYYTDEARYFEAYHRVRQRARLLIDRTLWSTYCRQVQMGQALYVDQYFGLRDKRVLGDRMTEQEQKDWFEHNAYWALYSSDRYVWCYSERMNWWTGEGVPPGAEDVLRSATLKVENGQELGFDLDPIIELAELREMAEVASKLIRKEAAIVQIPEVATAPQIDGHLEDHVWKLSQPLESFVPLASSGREKLAKTTSWATYDSRNLYVAILCDEPEPRMMYIVGEERDDDIWGGDEVELLISLPNSPQTFFHFIVNPLGVYWDSIHRVGDDKTYDPLWEQAALLGPSGWSAEFAIPWKALKVNNPGPGTQLRANLCRQRGQAREQSCWSPMAESFLEPELFGTWILQ